MIKAKFTIRKKYDENWQSEYWLNYRKTDNECFVENEIIPILKGLGDGDLIEKIRRKPRSYFLPRDYHIDYLIWRRDVVKDIELTSIRKLFPLLYKRLRTRSD